MWKILFRQHTCLKSLKNLVILNKRRNGIRNLRQLDSRLEKQLGALTPQICFPLTSSLLLFSAHCTWTTHDPLSLGIVLQCLRRWCCGWGLMGILPRSLGEPVFAHSRQSPWDWMEATVPPCLEVEFVSWSNSLWFNLQCLIWHAYTHQINTTQKEFKEVWERLFLYTDQTRFTNQPPSTFSRICSLKCPLVS